MVASGERDLRGERILEYDVVRALGEGGMGTVYLGVHAALGQRVAIKVLSSELSSNAEVRERFLQEARIQIALRHRSIVQVHTASTEGGGLALVMEYVDGPTLGQALATRGALPLDEALPLIGLILEAVGYAHGRGVVHRDLKPSNLLLSSDGGVKVTDFGIAKVVGGTKMTRTGTVMGSAEYMSPEQVVGSSDIDLRSDLYSLGATFFEMLTGKAPFEGIGGPDSDSDYLVREAHVRRPAPDPRTLAPHLPERVAMALVHALAKEPDDRPQTAGEFWEEISEKAAAPSTPVVPAEEDEVERSECGERVTRREAPPEKTKKRRGCAGFGIAVVALVILGGLVLVVGGVGGGLYWNWARTKTIYCATVVERWGVQECDAKIGARQQKRRETTHALTVKKGKTLRVDRVNGFGISQSATEYVYGEDGRLDELLERNDRDRITGRWVYSDDLSRRDRQRRNGAPTHDAELLEFDAEGWLVEVRYRTDAGGPRDVRDGVFGRRFQNDERGRVVRETLLGLDGTPAENKRGVGYTQFTNDDRGNVVETGHHRADGTPWHHRYYQWAPNLWAIKRNGYDEHGNLTSEKVFDPGGEPLHRHRYTIGPHEIRYSHGERGQLLRKDHLDEQGRPVVTRNGYAAEVYAHDERGRVIEQAYLDETGEPAFGHGGVHRTTTEYSDEGLTREVRYFDRHGQALKRRWSGAAQRIREDEFGDTVEMTSLDESGAPMLNKHGYATARYLLDEAGLQTEESYLGTRGEPAINYNCVSRVTQERDEFGEILVQSRFGVHGEPAGACGCDQAVVFRSVVDGHGRLTEFARFGEDGGSYANDGTARTVWQRDEAGRATEVAYYDLRDRLRRGKGVIATERFIFDARGREYERWYFDHEGERTLSDGVAGKRSAYDDAGRLVEATYLDEDGHAADSSSGYATESRTYDVHGTQRSVAYRDAQANPVEVSGGYASWQSRFDGHGDEVEKVYLDAAGNPVNLAAGWASATYVRDELGRIVETRYFNAAGVPVAIDEGYSIRRRVYDDRSHVISTSYFGAADEPIEIDDGWARLDEEFDEWGDRVAGAFFGADGEPVTHGTSGHYRFTNSYDERGRRVEWAFFDADGDPMSRSDAKCHRERLILDVEGRPIETTYWDANGDPCDAWWGYQRYVMERDCEGDIVSKKLWDRRGKKVK